MISSTANPKLFQPAPAWIAMLGLGLVTLLCIGLRLSLLRLAFPGLSLVVAVFLYLRYPLLYVGFSWWIWFLAAIVRRLLDFQTGFVDPSTILLAPFLVSGVSILTVLRELPRVISSSGLPFVLCLVGVLYGFLIGALSNPINGAIVALLNWLTPLTFGFHLLCSWRRFPELRQLTERVFTWGALVMGSYGVMQFLIAPNWDRYRLQGTGIQTFGTANPLGIRVWSTMHSPQPFAIVMMAGLLILLSTKSPLKLPASGVGYLAFLLSLARSAWLSWAIGIAVFLPSLKAKFQMRLIIVLLAMMLVVVPLVSFGPFANVIGSRIFTLTTGSQDTSYIQRAEGFNKLFSDALTEVAGNGLGYVIDGSSIGSNDSGILTLLLNLGWVGTLPYLGGLLLLIGTLLRSPEAAFDPFVSASRAIAIATFSQISLNNAMLQAFGMVLWSFIGLAMAAKTYYTKTQTNSFATIQRGE
jgi:hypothetical protein